MYKDDGDDWLSVAPSPASAPPPPSHEFTNESSGSGAPFATDMYNQLQNNVQQPQPQNNAPQGAPYDPWTSSQPAGQVPPSANHNEMVPFGANPGTTSNPPVPNPHHMLQQNTAATSSQFDNPFSVFDAAPSPAPAQPAPAFTSPGSQHMSTPQAVQQGMQQQNVDFFGDPQNTSLVSTGDAQNYGLEEDMFGLNISATPSQQNQSPSVPVQAEADNHESSRQYKNPPTADSHHQQRPASSDQYQNSRTADSHHQSHSPDRHRNSSRASVQREEDEEHIAGMLKDVEPKQFAYAKTLETQANDIPQDASPLPDAEAIIGSGHVLSRISLRTIITKKWKQSYWVQYGSTQILLFRSVGDYQDWLTNPYHPPKVRDFLVKESIDFSEELQRSNVVGFQMTKPAMKSYERGDPMMWHFKLEKWMDYGATIAAAFASPNPKELEEVRKACASCIRASRRGGNERTSSPFVYDS
jgi:hypothetical protein